MPANGGLFQCVLRVSRSPEGADGPISDLSLCGKKSRSWRPKRCGAESLRLGAVAAGSVLRLKSRNMKTGIRAGPDQAAQTAATIRPAHHARWRRRCRAEAALRLRP